MGWSLKCIGDEGEKMLVERWETESEGGRGETECCVLSGEIGEERERERKREGHWTVGDERVWRRREERLGEMAALCCKGRRRGDGGSAGVLLKRKAIRVKN